MWLSRRDEKPIRVCFPFVGDSVGGSHLSAMLLIEHLDRTLVKPIVVLHEEGALADELNRRGLAYEVLPLDAYAGETPKVLDTVAAARADVAPLVRFMREHKIEIVHTNDLRMHLTWPLAVRLSGRRFVNHQRVILSRSPVWRILALLATRIVCISGAVYNSLPSNGQSKARIIANPIDHGGVPESRDAARVALLSELELPATCKLIGYVGNMTRQKRPLVFLRTAAAMVDVLGDDVHFVMVGDNRGRELDATRALARQLGLAHRTHYLGFRLPIEPVISALDLLIAPGVNDAFGRTVAEAMISGTPVVASASGGHIELLENGRYGLLALPDDHYSFAICGLKLLENAALANRLLTAAKEKSRAIYSVDAHISGVTAIYEDLMPRRRTRTRRRSRLSKPDAAGASD